MVNREVIQARLDRLRHYVSQLKRIQSDYTRVQFIEDALVHGAGERYLHLAVESLLDIGNHVIADKGYRRPETYSDVLNVLAEEQIIPADLARELSGMAAFRNLLVHDYLQVDPGRVYDIMIEKILVIERLATLYATLL